MAKKSALSRSASDDDSENDSEHSAHSNILHKKNKGHTGKGRTKSKSRGTRAENWSVAQTTFLVHLYGNNMLSPELPLKLPAWNIIVAAMVKQHPERKENCSRDQVKALWFKTQKMTRRINRLNLTGGVWDHDLHRPAYSDEQWAALEEKDPEWIQVHSDSFPWYWDAKQIIGISYARGTDIANAKAPFNPGKKTPSSSKKRAHSPQSEQSGADLGQDAETEGEDSQGPSLARLGVQDLLRPFGSSSPAAGAQARVHTKAAFASLLNPLDPRQSSEPVTSSRNGGSKAKRGSHGTASVSPALQDDSNMKDAVASLAGLGNVTTSGRVSHFMRLVGTLSLEANDVDLLADHALVRPVPSDILKVLLLATAGVSVDMRVRQMVDRLNLASFQPVSSSHAPPSHEAPPFPLQPIRFEPGFNGTSIFSTTVPGATPYGNWSTSDSGSPTSGDQCSQGSDGCLPLPFGLSG